MKHTFIFTAAAAICLCPIGHSQSAPILTRVDISSDGTATLIVRNDSDVALVAFVGVEESHPVASDGKKYKVTAVRWWDVATDLAHQLVAPHHEIGILTGTPGAPPQATLMAAVFADGSSFGDPAWVQRIMIRRQVMRDGFDLAFSLLEKGMRQGTSRADLITQLTASKDHYAPKTSLSEEAAWATRYHGMIVHNLTKNTYDTTGAPISDQRAMEGVMALRGMYRDRFELYGVHSAASSHEGAQ
jgi:hypothetical protein